MADTTEKYSYVGMDLLKANLGYYGTTIPTELRNYLEYLMEYALNEFAGIGINLTPGILNDDMDQMIYAAWMYRKGVNGEGKTEMLKAIIRNRQVRNALAEEGST